MKKKSLAKNIAWALMAVLLLSSCGQNEDEHLAEVSTPEGSIEDPYADLNLGGEQDVQYVDAETGEPIDLTTLSADDVLSITQENYGEWQGLAYRKTIQKDEGSEKTDFLLDNAGDVHIQKSGSLEGEMYLMKADNDKYNAYIREKDGQWVQSQGIDNPVTPEYLAEKHEEVSSLLQLLQGTKMQYDDSGWTFEGDKLRDDIALTHVDQYFFIPGDKAVMADQIGHSAIECPVKALVTSKDFALQTVHMDLSRLANADPDSESKTYVVDLEGPKVSNLNSVKLPEEAKNAPRKAWAEIDTNMPKSLKDAD